MIRWTGAAGCFTAGDGVLMLWQLGEVDIEAKSIRLGFEVLHVIHITSSE